MRQAETLVWPGGEHAFRLGIGELRALEDRCDAGCSIILMRVLGQTWKINDIWHTLRLGLIGGGMTEKAAQEAVSNAFDTASPMALSIPAADVLRRFLMWEGADQPGEAQAGEASSPTRSQTDEPAGQPTTEPAQ